MGKRFFKDKEQEDLKDEKLPEDENDTDASSNTAETEATEEVKAAETAGQSGPGEEPESTKAEGADQKTEGAKKKGEEPKTEDAEQKIEGAETEGDTSKAEAPKEEQKKKRFGRNDESAAKLAAANAQIAELNDSIRRNLAEFDNYRKRTDKEKAARFEMGQKNVVEHMLPIVDNFERGLATLSEEALVEPFADGMNKTYKQLLKALEELGVKPIEAVGQPFNPDFHNAVMHVDDENVGENIVVEEFQKGYVMNDTVVRYSMVKVAN